MRFAKILTAVAAVSLAGTPALAQAGTSASKLSVASVSRTGGLQNGQSDLRGRSGGSAIVIALLAAAAIIAGIIIAVDGGDNDPVSP